MGGFQDLKIGMKLIIAFLAVAAIVFFRRHYRVYGLK